jgi:hypothetical protein
MKKRKRLWSYAMTWLWACSPYIDNGILWCNICCISFFSKGGFYGSKVSSSSISKVVTLQMLLELADYLLFFHLRIKYGRNLMAFWCMDSLGILWLFSRDKMKLSNKQEPTIMCDNSQTIHCLVCWSFSFNCRKIIHENVISMIQEIGYINNLLYSHC